MSSVVLEHVRKVFPRAGGPAVEALRNFSLRVAEHEFLVLLGPSGCGKTTALRLIAGLEVADTGSIWIGGMAMDRVPPQARDVAMVFQHHALYPHMTVRQNLTFGLQLRKLPRAEIETRLRETAEALELAGVLDVLPASLSGGQRQRVALGRALARRPQVLLCDEPFSQLDAPLRAQMRAELLRLRERFPITVIFVTHDQVEALTLGDRVAVLHDGALQQVDTPERIYREPANLFVAGFVGAPPMNFIAGTLCSENGELRFQAALNGVSGWQVAAGHAAMLASRVGQPVVLGVRPEQVSVGGVAANSGRGSGFQPGRGNRQDACPTIRLTESCVGLTAVPTPLEPGNRGGAPRTPSGDEASPPRRLTESPPGCAEVEVTIRLVERAGAEAWVHGETGTQRIVARVPDATTLHPGARVVLRLDLSRACLFDAVTQQAILAPLR